MHAPVNNDMPAESGGIYIIYMYIIDVKCFVLKVNKEGGKSAKR